MNAVARFAGKVALVTGAGKGIGFATARLLAHQGGRVICADRDGTASADVAFLLSDDATYVTASEYDVDGGILH